MTTIESGGRAAARAVNVTSFSMPYLGIAFVVMLVLKLLGKIDVSWWIVTAPLWGPWALAGGIVLIIGLVVLLGLGIAWSIDWYQDRQQAKRRAAREEYDRLLAVAKAQVREEFNRKHNDIRNL